MPVPPSWAREGGLMSPLTAAARNYEDEVLGEVNYGMGRLSPSPEGNGGGEVVGFNHPGLSGGYSPPKLPPVEPERGVVVVQTQNGGLVKVPWNTDMLGEDIKKSIEETDGVDLSRQRLWLPDGGELDNFSTLREGEKLKLSVVASPRRQPTAFQPPSLPESILETNEYTIRRDPPDEPLHINFDKNLVVEDVDPDGAAGRSGIPKDVKVLEINGRKVCNIVDFRRELLASDGDVAVVVTKKSNLAPDSTEVGGPHPGRGVEMKDVRREDREIVDGNCAWLLKRFCVGFSVFLAVIVGLVALILAGAESDRDCGNIEKWTIAIGVIYLLLGLCTGGMLFNLYRQNIDLFDIRDVSATLTLGSVSFLLITILCTTIVGLVILSRDMSRDERDACSPFRDMVMFLVIAVSTSLVLLIIIVFAICTYNSDVFNRHQRYKEERAQQAGLPSIRPQHYLLDRGNPRVPYSHV